PDEITGLSLDLASVLVAGVAAIEEDEFPAQASRFGEVCTFRVFIRGDPNANGLALVEAEGAVDLDCSWGDLGEPTWVSFAEGVVEGKGRAILDEDVAEAFEMPRPAHEDWRRQLGHETRQRCPQEIGEGWIGKPIMERFVRDGLVCQVCEEPNKIGKCVCSARSEPCHESPDSTSWCELTHALTELRLFPCRVERLLRKKPSQLRRTFGNILARHFCLRFSSLQKKDAGAFYFNFGGKVDVLS